MSYGTVVITSLILDTLFLFYFRSSGVLINVYCRYSYAGTRELVNLFVGTKNFSIRSIPEGAQNGRFILNPVST